MTREPLPGDFAGWPCGGWCVGECPGCCACGNTGCSGCDLDDVPLAATPTVRRFDIVGEEGCTYYSPVGTAASPAELEFDTSPETLRQLREALRRTLGPS